MALNGSTQLAAVKLALHLDEASGNALDSSSNAYHFTDTNTVGAAEGGRSFVGTSSEYFTRADNADISWGDLDLCLFFWAKIADPTTVQTLVSKVGASHGEFNLMVASQKLRVTVWSSVAFGGEVTFTASSLPDLELSPGAQWHSIGFWHDATNNLIGLSLDGTAQTFSHSAGIYNSAENMHVSGQTPYGQYFTGGMKELVFWRSYILTSTERGEFHNSGTVLPYPFGGGSALATGGISYAGTNGTSTILMTGTTATGGTSPYTYRWQRSTVGGGSGFSDLADTGGVSGSATLSLTDGSASVGTLYYYRMRSTDDVAATVNSSEVSAQVYTGGAITGGSGGGANRSTSMGVYGMQGVRVA